MYQLFLLLCRYLLEYPVEIVIYEKGKKCVIVFQNNLARV